MSLILQVVTPERLLLQRKVSMVMLPGANGYFSVKPGHENMIVMLGKGLMKLWLEELELDEDNFRDTSDSNQEGENLGSINELTATYLISGITSIIDGNNCCVLATLCKKQDINNINNEDRISLVTEVDNNRGESS